MARSWSLYLCQQRSCGVRVLSAAKPGQERDSDLRQNAQLRDVGAYSPMDWYAQYPAMYVGEPGKARVSMLLIGSAAMYHVRQIYRHQVSQKTADKGPKDSQTAVGSAFRQPLASFLAPLWNYLLVALCSIHPLRPISGYSS